MTRRYQLTTWQPRRRRFKWLPPEERPGELQRRGIHPDRKIPPHDDSRWPPWWDATRRCMGGYTMYRCEWCWYGTRRRGPYAPGHCVHCGFSVKRMILGTEKRVKTIQRPIVYRTHGMVQREDPERMVLTVLPFGVVNSVDPFEDELTHEQCW